MMTENQLIEKLKNLGLILIKRNDENYVVGRSDIGNPLLFFNPKYKGEEYSGTIQLKAYNIELYSQSQLYPAIRVVNEFLLGDLLDN